MNEEVGNITNIRITSSFMRGLKTKIIEIVFDLNHEDFLMIKYL
jgi:hypothetical protein